MFKAQHAEHLRLKKAGHIFPQVFFREVAEGRGGDKKPQPIVSFGKAWKSACKAADAEAGRRAEKWKDEMAPGEMWSLFGEKWVSEVNKVAGGE